MDDQAQARLAALREQLAPIQEQLRERGQRRAALAATGEPDAREALDRELATLREERQQLLDEQLLLERELGLLAIPLAEAPEAPPIALPTEPTPPPGGARVVGAPVREPTRRRVKGAQNAPPLWVRLLTLLAVLTIVGLLSVSAIRYVMDRFLVPMGSSGAISAAELQALGLEERPGLTLEQQAWRYLLIADRDKLGAPSDEPTTVSFTVAPGSSASQIARELADQGLIQEAESFTRLLRYRGADQSLAAGTFELRRNMTMDEVIAALQGGGSERQLTFLEGWRAEEMAALVEQSGVDSAEAYMALVRDPARFAEEFDFLAGLPAGATLEGYLFPDSYRSFVEGASAESIIRLQLETFGRRVTPELRAAAEARGLSLHQAVTLASIVEREAVVDEERPTIAGVFLNRVNDGILLNADPTIQYALGYDEATATWWKRPLTSADLGLDSPYNSYLYPGLPPGPISNPGLDSIQATINAPPTEFYYFVSKNDGTHAFAVTLEEHQRNVDEFQSGE